MGIKHVEAFGDSLLVVQQVSKVCQCYNGLLNAYLDRCFDIIASFDEFTIKHIPREENGKANTLAQKASGYIVAKKYFYLQKPMQSKAEVQVLDEPVQPVSQTGLTARTGLTGFEIGPTALSPDSGKKVLDDVNDSKFKDQDWRVPIIIYLKDICG